MQLCGVQALYFWLNVKNLFLVITLFYIILIIIIVIIIITLYKKLYKCKNPYIRYPRLNLSYVGIIMGASTEPNFGLLYTKF